MSETIYDIAIVGYGPIGQMLALLLGQKGYHVLVVERWPRRYPLPRAVHYDHEVARIIQAAGVSAALAPTIELTDIYEWRNAHGETLLALDQRGIGLSGWPESTMFTQPTFEAVLDAQVTSLPTIHLQRGWEVFQTEQFADHVALTMRKKNSAEEDISAPGAETRTLRARYLVGADGANSFILQQMDTSITDLGFLFDWLVVDVIPHEERQWSPLCWQLCDPARPTTLVSGGKGRRRWEFMRLEGESVEDLNQTETAWQFLAPWQVTPQNAILERHAVYTFRARWAENWRNGRILLAGDAAHLMPPFAGQGMGVGMRDVINLAWKLDLVLSERATDQILTTYTSERLPHVQHFINYSVELGGIICVTDPEAAAQRDAFLLIAREQPELAPPPPELPRLGPGILHQDDQLAGQLFLQGEVIANGKAGLFDDVVGRGFCLLSIVGDPATALTPQTHARFTALGGLTALLVSNGSAAAHHVIDVNGTYHDWFTAHDCTVVLTRPDFYIFGAASHLEDAETLVNALLAQLHPETNT
jgi:2-polyprenyl-6-methoxyphenol hydroxylase-like FAD-dependent oxidoreductase